MCAPVIAGTRRNSREVALRGGPRVAWRAIVVSAGSALTMALGMLVPSNASAQAPQCGQPVVADVRLESDLQCGGDGRPALVIGADDVDVDLGGHAILDDIASVGVSNSGYDRVTIRNGRIFSGALAVALNGASHNRLVALSSGRVVITGGEGNVVRDSVLSGGRSAALSIDSASSRIVGNALNGFFSGALEIAGHDTLAARNILSRGMFVFGSNHRIVRNRIEIGGAELYGSNAVFARNVVDVGRNAQFAVDVVGSGNVVRANALSNADFDGVLVNERATDTLLLHNVSTHNFDDGIDVRSPSTRLIGNRADDNGDLGIAAVPGVFARANSAHGNGNLLQCLNIACRVSGNATRLRP
jgi:hypothetical protein